MNPDIPRYDLDLDVSFHVISQDAKPAENNVPNVGHAWTDRASEKARIRVYCRLTIRVRDEYRISHSRSDCQAIGIHRPSDLEYFHALVIPIGGKEDFTAQGRRCRSDYASYRAQRCRFGSKCLNHFTMELLDM